MTWQRNSKSIAELKTKNANPETVEQQMATEKIKMKRGCEIHLGLNMTLFIIFLSNWPPTFNRYPRIPINFASHRLELFVNKIFLNPKGSGISKG